MTNFTTSYGLMTIFDTTINYFKTINRQMSRELIRCVCVDSILCRFCININYYVEDSTGVVLGKKTYTDLIKMSIQMRE